MTQQTTITASEIYSRFHQSHGVTHRESQVALDLMAGKTAKTIATESNLSEKTIEAQKYSLMGKLDVHNRAQLINLILGNKNNIPPVPTNDKKPPMMPATIEEHLIDIEFDNFSNLTPRELQVLVLVGDNKKIREIAEELNIENSTVKAHLSNIFQKTDTRDKKELRDSFNKSKRGQDVNLSPNEIMETINTFWPQEMIILKMLSEKHKVPDIATELDTTPEVIRAHIDCMAKKLGLRNWHQLAAVVGVIQNAEALEEKPQTIINNQGPELTGT